jgi:membrane-associated phospholipid phosphatase
VDRSLLRLLRTRGHSPGIERAVGSLSSLGEHGRLWQGLALAGAALDAARRPVYLRGLRAVLAGYGANQAVKLLVRRRRPRLQGLPPLTDTMSDLSYPSAHATTSFAAAGTLSAALPAPPLYAAAAAMALSRPYLGVHYPSDALAGAVLGLAIARLVP